MIHLLDDPELADEDLVELQDDLIQVRDELVDDGHHHEVGDHDGQGHTVTALKSPLVVATPVSGRSHSHPLAAPAGSTGAHDHGGPSPSHEGEPTRTFSRLGLVGMGIAGGIVPSPSALVILLSAIALGRTAFGVLLVLAYGIGMAVTLTVAGVALVFVRDRYVNRFTGRISRMGDRWRRIMPFATAGLVIVVGTGLALRSLWAL